MEDKQSLIESFKVDLSKIADNRKPGVSGLMRVCNDAEFLEESVLSCIDALDELIIVYNNCTDNSPSIIKRLAEEYPDKIKIYEYLPEIKAWNLNDDEIIKIISSKEKVYTIANYYNYCLSKSTYAFALKIDADQVYYTEKLKELLDCYRINLNKVRFLDVLVYESTVLYIALARRFKFIIPAFNRYSWWELYEKAALNIIRKYKCNSSLSGVNVLFTKRKKYIQLGEYTKFGNNILPPFNGVGDHQVFEVTKNTFFEPHVAKDYSKLNKMKGSLIERLRGLGRPIHLGLYWIHLNSNRLRYREYIEINLSKYPDRYSSIDNFRRHSFKEMSKDTPEEQCTFTQKIIFSIIHNSFTENFAKFMTSFNLTEKGILKRNKQ